MTWDMFIKDELNKPYFQSLVAFFKRRRYASCCFAAKR